MFRNVVLLLCAMLVSASPMAMPRCERPDLKFGEFLGKFKSDVEFRESRLIFPLQFTFSDPSGKTREAVSLKQIRERKWQIIRDEKFAKEQENGEGRLCETTPQVRGNSARFGQHSCSTDVYSSSYHFVRLHGCWFLKSVEDSGG